ncbi:hypothetical protein HYDPIDRAFT_38875 [Hydnomerulius pinastri MD-312]|nr:hypothetical protein HYDPIDRAFT_38875 [Hydnomerulius pinastri MD-312]
MSSPWQLPGRRESSGGVNAFKSLLAKSLGFSRQFNTRNLEYMWYPEWCCALMDLVADIPNLIVAPQFPAWFTAEDLARWEEEQGEEEDTEGDEPVWIDVPGADEDTSNDEDAQDEGHGGMAQVANRGEATQNKAQDGVGEDNVTKEVIQDDDADMHSGDREAGANIHGFDDLADISFETVSGRGMSQVIIDYAVLHVSVAPHSDDRHRYCGWRINSMSVPLIVEEKRFPSRSLRGQELSNALQLKLSEAQSQLVFQAAHLFLQDQDLKSIIAIAASGPYWRHTTIRRERIQSTIAQVAANTPYLLLGPPPVFRWTTPLRLDLAASNKRMHTIYNRLRERGVEAVPAAL